VFSGTYYIYFRTDHSDLHFGLGVSPPGLQNIDWRYSFAPEGTPRDLRSNCKDSSGVFDRSHSRPWARPLIAGRSGRNIAGISQRSCRPASGLSLALARNIPPSNSTNPSTPAVMETVPAPGSRATVDRYAIERLRRLCLLLGGRGRSRMRVFRYRLVRGALESGPLYPV
jgi:hypothetical protein